MTVISYICNSNEYYNNDITNLQNNHSSEPRVPIAKQMS